MRIIRPLTARATRERSIKEKMVAQGISHKDLAKKLYIEVSTLYRWVTKGKNYGMILSKMEEEC